MSKMLPATFHVDIKRSALFTYRLAASQILSVQQVKAFEFFEDPSNLYDITPDWLDFCLLNKDSNTEVYENAEFDYAIKFLGIKMHWKSRIIDYKPPERFTDIQVMGPYKSWVHLHTLETVPEGTLMQDNVTYKLHLPALILHHFLIRKKLIDIFTYRAVKINAWAKQNT
jgi:ligand-binding SRPBCC domain-containing protein